MKKSTWKLCLAAALTSICLVGCSSKNSAATTSETAAGTTVAETAATETTAAETTTAETTVSETTTAETAGEETALIDLTGHTLTIYCGAGMTNPFQEISDSFKTATGCEMNVSFANAGQIQSQISTSEEGDMFIAGSADELKPIEAYVAASKPLVKHIPVLAVPAGNPKNISSLKDLANDDVSLIIGDVDATPIGKIAKKALTDSGIFEQVNIAATTTTAPQMATAIAAGEADAAIVWKENCGSADVEVVENSGLDNYIKTIPAAALTCASDTEALSVFQEYLDSDAAKAIWMNYGYEIVEE